MARKDVDRKRLSIRKKRPSEGTGVRLEDQMYVVVTQLFCPNGHNLVGAGSHQFDGFAGIAIRVTDGKREGVVELSPIHGDASKIGLEFPKDTRLQLMCPTCGVVLPRFARCTCPAGGELRKLFLTTRLDDEHLVAVCDVWGCTRSRVIDGAEILSEWMAGRIEAGD